MQVSNLRPLACEASALPLSYAPGNKGILRPRHLVRARPLGQATPLPGPRVHYDLSRTVLGGEVAVPCTRNPL